MSRIQLSAKAYLSKLSYFHCELSFAFYSLPEEVNDDNEKKIQATLDLISDYADFNEGHMINTTLHPPSSKSDTTFTVIRILMAKINKYQRDILDRTKTYKNINVVVLEQPSPY
jgi:hypothetical protein